MDDLINTGEEHFAAGRLAEAEKCFQAALTQDPDNREAHNNLGVIAHQRGNARTALACFARALEIDPCYREALLNFADLCRSAGQFEIAATGLKNYLQKHPDDHEVSAWLEDDGRAGAQPCKLALICVPGLESFLADIVKSLSGDHQVRTCYTTDLAQVEETVKWADTVWLEWANELTVAVTGHPTLLDDKQVICRLHSYEAFAGYGEQIRWDKIDDLIFVADHIKDFALQRFPEINGRVRRIHVVPNAVDLERFAFIQRPPGKNLAFLGNINYKKGPMLLLQALRELVSSDGDYRLFIGGNFQDARYALYFQQMVAELGLEKNLIVDGWVEDVPTWLADKHFVICSSVLEGHPVGLLEAMASGLKPLVHNFVGARGLYPDRYIWNTPGELVKLVHSGDYQPQEYRHFAEQFSLERQRKSIEQVLRLQSVAAAQASASA